MKKKIVAATLIVIMISMVAAGTAAYRVLSRGFTSNIITTGKIDMTLEEHFYTGTWGEVDGRWVLQGNVMPGEMLSKVVSVSNASANDPEKQTSFYTRVAVTVEIDDPELAEQVGNYVLPQFMDGAWFQGSDGWWYYDGIVEPGQETTPLFEEVKLAGDTPNSFMGKTVTIGVKAQAVQSKNNPAPGMNNAGVRSATGWPNRG